MENFRLNIIKKNFRPVQKIYKRKVYSSRKLRRPNYDSVKCSNGANKQLISIVLNLIAILIIYIY